MVKHKWLTDEIVVVQLTKNEAESIFEKMPSKITDWNVLTLWFSFEKDHIQLGEVTFWKDYDVKANWHYCGKKDFGWRMKPRHWLKILRVIKKLPEEVE